MFKRFSINLALIFVFVFAQIGAVTHGISHVNDGAKHGQHEPNKQDKSTHSEQCDQCISFAKIAGGLAAQSFEFPITQASLTSNTQLQTLASSQLFSAYTARAPPTIFI
jgi:hypothetical protein